MRLIDPVKEMKESIKRIPGNHEMYVVLCVLFFCLEDMVNKMLINLMYTGVTGILTDFDIV